MPDRIGESSAVRGERYALVVRLTGGEIGIGVRYNTDPPPLAEDTDTLFTVNLVYNIK